MTILEACYHYSEGIDEHSIIQDLINSGYTYKDAHEIIRVMLIMDTMRLREVSSITKELNEVLKDNINLMEELEGDE